MKKINLLALVVLVSINVLTPISYAGEIPENNPEIPENVVENVAELIEDSQDSLKISEGQEEQRPSQVIENDEEVKGENFKFSDRSLDVSVSEGDGTITSGCYTYKIVEGGIEIVKYNVGGTNCPNDVDLSNGVDGYDVISIGDDAFRGYANGKYCTITSIILGDSVRSIGENAFLRYQSPGNQLQTIVIGKNLNHLGYRAFGFNYEDWNITFPDGFDYEGLVVDNGENSRPRFIIQDESGCFRFDIGERQIYEYLCGDKNVVIPEKIKGFTVNGIYGYGVKNESCFWGGAFSNYIGTITIPSTITDIDSNAACYGDMGCAFSVEDSQILSVQNHGNLDRLNFEIQNSEFSYSSNQTLVGVKPYSGYELSSSITDSMLSSACMYRLEQHTVTFFDENGNQIGDQITVEGTIDESAFPVIEDEEGYGHSWVDQDGETYAGAVVTKNLNLTLKRSKIGILHEDGIIKISDGTNEIWLRDRNVGATVSTGVNKVDELMNLAYGYVNSSCGLYSERSPSETFLVGPTSTFLEEAAKIMGVSEVTCDDVLDFIDSFDEEEYKKSFGNYYFRGNNGYATYDEMNFDNEGYSSRISQDAIARGFSKGGKMNEENTGWEGGNRDNPCDAMQGEYLPTAEDWVSLMTAWANINETNLDDGRNNEGRYQAESLGSSYGTIGFHDYGAYSAFANDMLLPTAGGVWLNPSNCAFNLETQMACRENEFYYSNNGNSNYLRTARDDFYSIGMYNVYNGEIYRNDRNDGNYYAYPVRCFMIVDPVTVNFDTDGGSGIESYKVEKGSTIVAPVTPTKDGYTFVGWYTSDDVKWDFDTMVVNKDVTLYAKWRVCGEGFMVKGNKCIPNDMNMEGIIEVSDGNDTMYIRDRNVGANEKLDIEKINILYECADKSVSNEDLLQCVNDGLSGSFTDIDDLWDYWDELEYSPLQYGNYYFRGNNSGVNYNELDLSGYDEMYLGNLIKNMSDLGEKFLEGGKINEPEGLGWIVGNQQDNPCNGEGEYLPAPEDWINLIKIWANKKGYTINIPDLDEITPVEDNENNNEVLNPISPDNQLHSLLSFDTLGEGVAPISSPIFTTREMAMEFGQDMLIPYAGGIQYNKCPSENNEDFSISYAGCDNSMYYSNLNSALRTAQSGGKLGIFDGNDIFTNTAENLMDMGANGVAYPVRCFVKMNIPEVLVVTLMSEGKIVKEVNVVSGDKLSQPADPTKNGYKFLGWYTSETGGERRNFENNTVNEDIKLYAHREKNQESGSNSSGGGGSSNKTETPKEDSKSNVDNGTTVDDGQKDNEKSDDKNEGKKWNNGDSSNNSEVVKTYNNKYTPEFNQAYQFAYKNSITTKNTIEKADMNGKLTRIAMAKMLSQYAINVLGKTPDTSRSVKFKDVSDKRDTDYNNGVTLAYQLGIMGINMKDGKFRPDDEVTRGEFVTALSRLLYRTSDGQYESTAQYYTNHMEKLKREGIVTKTDPKMKELRGYVMIMLMRSAK